jgi:uncharacterized repeat protein (TIGR01451 family)
MGRVSVRRRAMAAVLLVMAVALPSARPVLAAGDFTLLVLPPGGQLLPPGGAVAFSVEVGSIGGFADPVHLEVGDLPDGVTAVFGSTTVTPPATVALTLSASADAATGDFSLEVTGTSGALSHTTTGSVTVDFGLVPVCNGFVQGTITDEETGDPIEGVSVAGPAPTDAAGHWGPITVQLGENNSPVSYFTLARKDGYWDSVITTDTVICGQTTTINQTLLKYQPAVIQGHVVLGIPDPADPNNTLVDPAGGPIADASIGTVGFPCCQDVGGMSDADGAFHLDLPHLGFRNAPITLGLQGGKEGYWGARYVAVGEVHPYDTKTADYPMVPQCHGSISGTVTLSDTGGPAVGVTVSANFLVTTTDAAGHYEYPALLLDFNNQPAGYGISARLDDYTGPSQDTTLTGCGDHQTVNLVLDPLHFGVIEGYVTDEETGDPIEGASVGPQFCFMCDFSEATTDATGFYRVKHIPSELAQPTNYFVRAFQATHWEASDDVDVTANQTSRLDLVMLKVRHASVSGVVRDSVTGEALEDAGVGASSAPGPGAVTDATGAYHIDGLGLGDRNGPGASAMSVSREGYWPAQATIEYAADEEVVQNFELLKICPGATIRGHVVDFVTGDPIEGAQVSATGAGSVLTDVDGAYQLNDVPVGNDNSPNAVTVGVSAVGYFSQSRQVTVFCGARFQLDFAPPAPTSALEGTVTDAVTGDPIADATVIGEWGDQTTTDADGDYTFDGVPLQADGSDHTWDVSALTDDCGQATKSFTAKADVTARVDFAFCSPPQQGEPGISLEKSGLFAAGTNAVADAGELIAFTLTVKNTGDVDLHGVTVTDPKLGTVTCPGSTIGVGSSMVCTGSYAVTQADIDAGSVANTASADATETEPTTASTTVTLPRQAALSLAKVADRTTFDATGVKVGYTFTLTNSGDVTLVAPFTVTDDQAADEACPSTPTSLAPGAKITCTASDTTTQADLDAGQLTNIATAQAKAGSSTVTSGQATATVTATQRASLTLVKTANPTTFSAPGQGITYTYVLTNAGNVTLAAPYGVADDRSTDEHCPSTPATLAPGATVSCSATYAITAADVTAGSVTNHATATATRGVGTVTSNVATATVTFARVGAQIAPTQTTCQQYRAGATSLTEALYVTQKDKIGSVAPGVMFVYDTVTVGAAPVTLSVAQSRQPSLPGWTAIPVQDVGQIVLYDQATCLKSKAQGTTAYASATGTVTVQIKTPGAYILGIKYNLSALSGIVVGKTPPTGAYTFASSGSGTSASITIRPKK